MRRLAIIGLLAFNVAACGEQAAPAPASSPAQAAPDHAVPMNDLRQPEHSARKGAPRTRRDGPVYDGKTY